MMEDLLKTLLESKTKLDLVTFIFSNPERAFYVGEIKTRIGGRNLDADFNYLEKLNLVSSFTKKGKRYFRVNTRNPLYAQLKSQIQKTTKKSYEDELVKTLTKLPGIKVAVLSGLFVGNIDAECDVLLVGKIPEQKVKDFSKGVEKSMGQEINYALFDVEEYQYRKNMFDRFMKNIFENENIIILNKIK